MILIVVPGVETYAGRLGTGLAAVNVAAGRGQAAGREFSHGWPMTYLRSVQTPKRPATGPLLSTSKGRDISWSDPAAWPAAGHSFEWNAPAFMLNLCLVVVFPLATGLATHAWIQRRGGRLRVRLIDLVGLTTAAALILGWHTIHVIQQRREAQTIAALQAKAKPIPGRRMVSTLRVSMDYAGPAWLERLVGNPRLLPRLWHVSGISGLQADLLTSSEWSQIRALPDLTSLAMVGRVSKFGMDCLAKCESLRDLQCEVSPEDVCRFARLHQLRSLEITSVSSLVEEVECLAGMSALEHLALNISSTKSEFDALRKRFPDIDIDWLGPRERGQPVFADAFSVLDERVERWHQQDNAPYLNRVVNQNGDVALDLTGVRLTSERLATLVEPSRSFTRLALGRVESPDEVIAFLEKCKSLIVLDAHGIPLRKEHLPPLLKLRTIEWLSINQGELSAKDVAALSVLPLQSLTIFNGDPAALHGIQEILKAHVEIVEPVKK
jgi:hypothetical protein